jgi:type VI secretion system protein ImpH
VAAVPRPAARDLTVSATLTSAVENPACAQVEALFDQARRMAFFRLVEQIHRLHGDDLEHGVDAHPEHERIRYESAPGLGFPASDVRQLANLPGHPEGKYRLQASFLGVHGVDSPLPGHYLERVAQDAAHASGLRAAFLDFFHHRLLTLLHRGWRKYRYHERFQPGARDRFSRSVFSLVGLNDERLRGDTPLPWSRLLTYAGVIASRSRSPSAVAGILAHCFDLPHVVIHEFQQHYTDVPDDQRNALGMDNVILGGDFTLGSRVPTCSNKFLISIQGLSERRFRDFLPNGEAHPSLRKLVEFLLRDQLAYDLELQIVRDEIPPFCLHREQGAHLGWTTFAGDVPSTSEATARITMRA